MRELTTGDKPLGRPRNEFKRKCLSCRLDFKAASKFNRICADCRKKNAETIFPDDYEFGTVN